MNKYRNVRVEFDEIKFDSKREANRYVKLMTLRNEGEITGLTIHPVFNCSVNGVDICKYEADFSYYNYDNHGELIVEDVKSTMTRKLPVYRLKKKLMRACFNIDITEIV